MNASGADLPTEQDHDSITLGWDEAEHECVLATAIVTFWRGLPKWTFGVQNNLLMFRSNEVVDDMRSRRVPSRIAEPLAADKTFHY